MLTDKLPRIPIAILPTPLHPLPRFSKQLGGPRIYIKRDDLTGLATGGNKARKLEFLLADAIQQGADTVITAGAPQSNHCRQTAAAAAQEGLHCVLALGTSGAHKERNGNLLLDELLGAEIRWVDHPDQLTTLEAIAEELRQAGRTPYIIPYGGSNPLGAAGYVDAFEELRAQCLDIDLQTDRIVFATSSGGTQAGLLVGAAAFGFTGQIEGISVSKPAHELIPRLQNLIHETAALLAIDPPLDTQPIIVHDAYLGEGYGIVGEPEREAIRLLAQTEGILVDPVYTGRALAGLIDLIRKGTYGPDETILFWHTGGIPALFAYSEEI